MMETFSQAFWSDADMDPKKLTDPVELEFHGKRYRVVTNNSKGHPSIYAHYDEFITRDLWWNIAEGDVVLDVGADFGSYSLPALTAGASLVIAWSPPSRASLSVEGHTLATSAWENGFEDRLLVEPYGLWSERGWLVASDGRRPPTLHRTRDEAVAIANESQGLAAFPVKTLDEYLERAPLMLKDFPASLWKRSRKWWLKIDVNGGELEVLRGARGFIAAMRPTILVQNQLHFVVDAERIVEEFVLGLRLDYEKVGTIPRGFVSHSLYAPSQGAK